LTATGLQALGTESTPDGGFRFDRRFWSLCRRSIFINRIPT
jgi:hypothetical protein